MPAFCGPRWTHESTTRHISHSDPGLRVSDAERAAVADRLSKHYGDGRLDEAEFNERLDQAMKAKTQADLSGLLSDLPDTDPPGTGLPGTGPAKAAARQSYRRPYHRVLFLFLILVIAAALGHTLLHWYFPWLLIGLLAFIVLRHTPRSRR